MLREGTHDAVLLDLGLPDSHGLDTLVKARTQAPRVPIVVLTGFDDEAAGAKAVQQGAQDYMVKVARPGGIQASVGAYSAGTPSSTRVAIILEEHAEAKRGNQGRGARPSRSLKRVQTW